MPRYTASQAAGDLCAPRKYGHSRPERIRTARIPPYASAVLNALQFSSNDETALHGLSEADWNQILTFCDSCQLTLLFGDRCRPCLPDFIATRIHSNYRNNSLRFERLKTVVCEIAGALAAQSIEFAVLKGFTHFPTLIYNPLLRVQGDVDLWCLPETVFTARDVLSDLGYRPIARSTGRHLDPMARDTAWKWRGDYFDPDLPIPVDLHYELWDRELERMPGVRENEIWARRSQGLVNNRTLHILTPADTLAFAAVHFMMHVLHGDVRLQGAWELAYVLNQRGEDESFWTEWQNYHAPEARTLQLVAFLLVDHWFGCGLPDLIAEELQTLSPDVFLWMDQYGFSPIERIFSPNKDDLWLNVCLLDSFASKARVLRRRLFPMGTIVSRPQLKATSTRWPRPRSRSLSFLSKRAYLHVRTLLPACVQGLRWWRMRQQLGRDFLLFLLVSILFDFGEFIFFVLYNLYLLDLGYSEKFLGQVSAALTAGTFVSVLPAAAVTHKLGLRKAVLLAIGGAVSASILRAALPWRPTLLAAAFLNGLFMSFWAVSLPPAVAGLTKPHNRTLGFTLISAIGIGVGFLAGILGGHLPALLLHFSPGLLPVKAKQIALLTGSGLASLSMLPMISLALPSLQTSSTSKNIYPRGRFIYSFLSASFLWSIGTGAFNPFFNAYLSRHLHIRVEAIGSIFSFGQLAQVFTILLAPAILRAIGQVNGIALMQLATAAMVFALATVTSPALAAASYIIYMCFQYMSEPCLLSMLMSNVTPEQQSGASALHFMIIAVAGILSATVAGALFSRSGYSLPLMIFAVVTAVSAALFYFLLRPRSRR